MGNDDARTMKHYPSVTYKLKLPEHINKHSIYFTIAGSGDDVIFLINGTKMHHNSRFDEIFRN